MRYYSTLILFLLVLGLAYASSRLMGRRFQHRPGGALQVRDSLPLGRDRSLLLLEVGGRLLLVGSTPQGVSLLTNLDGVSLPAEVPAAEGPVSFGALLQAEYQKGLTRFTGSWLHDAWRRVAASLPGRSQQPAPNSEAPAQAPAERPAVKRASAVLGRLRQNLDQKGADR